MRKEVSSWESITAIRESLQEQYWNHWTQYDLFSFGWWLTLFINILFIYVALKFIDRRRLFELLTVGGIVIAISTLLDVILIQFGFTAYPTSITPLSTSFFVSTYIVLPVVYMLLYQFCSTWKKYMITTLITSFTLAFIIENLLRWANVYEYIKWNNFYSFIAYVGIGLIVKWFMIFFNSLYIQK
ncbi:CBO0543 family protein [Alkalihalobacillus macyae]|uniref:CBO0543 family protein n=1 Tax=Guptibacillus hwajinpoensis TaxID=208199 RepID=UPI00273B8220|nr:CBO0543 family protein [Alkalihalobacillus macyae]MDP4551416.1 CBO0543 family protein [Alkalihalobacillus macyae]